MRLLDALSLLLLVLLGGENLRSGPRGAGGKPIRTRSWRSCSSNLDPEQWPVGTSPAEAKVNWQLPAASYTSKLVLGLEGEGDLRVVARGCRHGRRGLDKFHR